MATYVVVVGSFLVYFHLQNQSKTAKKKLKELNEEQEKAELFIQEQTLKLYEKMQRAKRELEYAKTKGLSRAERMEQKEAERLARLKEMEITDVYSSSKFF